MHAVFDNGPASPCPNPFNMAAYVLGGKPSLANKVALEVLHGDAPDIWTYAQLESAVRSTARGLQNLGLAQGSRILMRIGNSVDFPIVYLAAITAGIIPVPTSAQLTSREISKIATEIQPDLIVAERGVAIPDTTEFKLLYIPEIRKMRDLEPADYVFGDPNRPAYIIYTSGTAGIPRAVVHAHRAIWARRMMWDGWYDLRRDERLLHAGAFNWTYTLGTGLMDPWTIGATSLIPGKDVSVDQLPGLLERTKASIFAAAPGIYRQILNCSFPKIPNLRHGLSAGEKMPVATHEKWLQKTGTKLYEAFGMSECSTFISSAPTHAANEDTLGFPQTGRRVAIIGENGPVEIGDPGIIAVGSRDPGLMLGYLGAEAETRSRYSGEWFLTGDTGVMNHDGAISYLGRADDMMNAGGFRVSPIEVETAMRSLKGISDCGVVEVAIKPDVKVIAAFYTGPGRLSDEKLSAHASATLARYKQPRLFIYRAKLPRGANNKLNRKKLRDGFSPS